MTWLQLLILFDQSKVTSGCSLQAPTRVDQGDYGELPERDCREHPEVPEVVSKFTSCVTVFMKISGRIEKEIFPEYKDDDLNLLEVTWNEDYVQQLGNHSNTIIIHLISSVPTAKAIFKKHCVRP